MGIFDSTFRYGTRPATNLPASLPDNSVSVLDDPTLDERSKWKELTGILSGVPGLDVALAKGILGSALPLGVMRNSKAQEIKAALDAIQSGDKFAQKSVQKAIIPTKEQLQKIAEALDAGLAGRPQSDGTIAFGTQKAFDSRMSGSRKNSGMIADAFQSDDVSAWSQAAGSDAASIRNRGGQPSMVSSYVDPVRGGIYPVEMPISTDLMTGRLRAAGVIPKGVFGDELPDDAKKFIPIKDK